MSPCVGFSKVSGQPARDRTTGAVCPTVGQVSEGRMRPYCKECGMVESEAGEKEGVAGAPPSRKTADGNADRREFTAVFGAFTE